VLLCLIAGCAHASSPRATSAVPEPSATLPPDRVVQAEVNAPATVTPGAEGELRVLLRIASGYHVMSDKPSNPLYIPTRVRFDDADGISFGATSYPAPQSFELGDERISTFEGERTVTAPFTVAQDAAMGPRNLTGTLEYQSCTRTSCLFPVKRALRAQLIISR
jgi:DsbC/DsbD-like thiol-disulfide interchange protein